MDNITMESLIDLDLSITSIWTSFKRIRPPGWIYEEKDGRKMHGIVLVCDGKADYTYENGTFTVEKGDLVFLPQNCKYLTIANYKVQYDFIVVSFNVNIHEFIYPLSTITVFKPSSSLNLTNQMNDLSNLWFYKGIAYKLKCKSILTDILYQLILHSIHEEMNLKNFSRIKPAVLYIESYYDRELSIQELADMSHLSVSHFRRLFKEIYKMTPVEYLNYYRISKAKDLIMGEMFTIGEIAEKIGYPSIYYFSRVFKKYTGVSPKNYI